MNTKFKNGSGIQAIDTKEEVKCEYIRGRRLTDEEYNRMMNVEIENAENKVSELLKYLDVDKYCKRHPSEFIEQFCGIKLLGFQKILLDMQYKGSMFVQSKSPYKKYETYLRLCHAFVNMKDDGTIAIARYPDDVKILTKQEFGNWLRDRYWC